MVWRHDRKHDHYNSNRESSGRNGSPGLSLLTCSPSAERKIRLYSRHVCIVDARCFGQSAFALCAFRRQQMPSRGTRPQDLASGSDLEAFRHCFTRFAACNRLRHTARRLIRSGAMTNAFLQGVCVRGWNRVGGVSEPNIVPFVRCNLMHGKSRR